MENQVTDRNALKVQALLNKNVELQNENADLKVELHIQTVRVGELTEELENAKVSLALQQENTEPDEVVQEDDTDSESTD